MLGQVVSEVSALLQGGTTETPGGSRRRRAKR
jgi:hypothetical protein